MRFLVLPVIACALLSGSVVEQTSEFCSGMQPPVDGAVRAVYAPAGRYAGHWGVDFAVPPGTPVRPAGPGTVVFAGTVVDNRTVTVAHGGGLRTSYSYLADVLVTPGYEVGGHTPVGLSGWAHGTPGLHFSVRVGSDYRDPRVLFVCRPLDLSSALRLVPVSDER